MCPGAITGLTIKPCHRLRREGREYDGDTCFKKVVGTRGVGPVCGKAGGGNGEVTVCGGRGVQRGGTGAVENYQRRTT